MPRPPPERYVKKPRVENGVDGVFSVSAFLVIFRTFLVGDEVSVPRPPTKAMTGLVGTAWGGSFRRV